MESPPDLSLAAAYSEYDDEKRAAQSALCLILPFGGPERPTPLGMRRCPRWCLRFACIGRATPQFAYARACNGVARQLKLRPRENGDGRAGKQRNRPIHWPIREAHIVRFRGPLDISLDGRPLQ